MNPLGTKSQGSMGNNPPPTPKKNSGISGNFREFPGYPKFQSLPWVLANDQRGNDFFFTGWWTRGGGVLKLNVFSSTYAG